MYQTRPPDETLVYISDWPVSEVLRLCEDFPHAIVSPQINRNDWGHHKRAVGLGEATGDVIGWFADDDAYDTTYCEKLMSPIEFGFDASFCLWSPGAPTVCKFESGSSTSGNFLIRTELARDVGWTGRHYEADGQFIQGVWGFTDRIVGVLENLYTHNAH